ncbi:MAG: TetR/AcrR family transcriptional regulator [Erysipelotrichaceae bacterium]
MKINILKTKVEVNKNEKEKNLMDTAFELFTKQGINKTSIQDIVDAAGVAKGTFYLYFHDKYDLQNQLIAQKSAQLFQDALQSIDHLKIASLGDEIIAVIDYVIDAFVKDKKLLSFIRKNLSLGLYSEKITKLMDENALGLHDTFMRSIKIHDVELENPEVTLFMIVELVGSTCYSCIIKGEPLSMDEYKPFLYKTIRMMCHC